MTFQTEAKLSETYGGFRDFFRRKIEEHYSSETKSFSRSFVIGSRNDCCVAAAGLASGLSFQTFAASRADCTRNRPYHSGRTQTHDRLDSIERESIEGYILELRDAMEGDKGALAGGVQKWHTGKLPSRIRFEDYKTSQIQSGLPVYGSHSLFKKIWKSHTEITEYSAKHHPKCD
eukprot:6213624-Pleurochrysis_carterae.AAC.2